MDHKTYKVNECVVLIYLMEASLEATYHLYNGKIYNAICQSMKPDVMVDRDTLGYKG